MVDFAGWSMPVQYGTGSTHEHHLVRRSAGLFDVSHMGQFIIRGKDSEAFLEHLVTCRVSSLGENQSGYGLLCREDGGVVDDVFVYRLEGHWLVVVNAANVEKDLRWMTDHLPASGVELEDASSRHAMFALQGPGALNVVSRIADLDDLARFAAARVSIGGAAGIVGRTGYTGEDGVELFLPTGDATRVWELLLAEAASADVECGPIGLAARDSLRFEPGFPLYGHELGDDISPIQARLKWACDLEKDFIGAEVLRRQAEEGVDTRLATIQLTDHGIPRQGYPVVHQGRKVGEVVSGMYAPTIDAYCANVFVHADLTRVGTELQVLIREKPKDAKVVKRPLYRPAYR